MNYINNEFYLFVIIFIMIGQFVVFINTYINKKRLNIKNLNNFKFYSTIVPKSIFKNKNDLNTNKELFYQWLVGLTDGDGTFSVIKQKNSWSLTFKISLNIYNIKLLYFIKSFLKYGIVTIDNKNKMASFRIRNIKILNQIIFPIFDRYPLLTTKYFNYQKIKEINNILENKSINQNIKNSLISNILEKEIPNDYISPVWKYSSINQYNLAELEKIMTKSWLIGFIEAEGSFYLVSKEATRLVHGFGITQKLDPIVLESIRFILHIKSKVRYNKYNFYALYTTNSRGIENIIKYFTNTMKGQKCIEFKIWSNSYTKYKGNYIELLKTREKIRRIRKINLD
jgi:hypothetical protein